MPLCPKGHARDLPAVCLVFLESSVIIEGAHISLDKHYVNLLSSCLGLLRDKATSLTLRMRLA